jgi:hypothetical protein
MATVTLHRAARLQEKIRSAIGRLSFHRHATLSIFSTDIDAEAERHSRRLLDEVTQLQRLLTILAELRISVGRQNAELGISALLAQKAAAQEEIAFLSRLVPIEVETTTLFITGRGRRSLATTAKRGRVSLPDQVSAARARFESGEKQEEDTIWVPLLEEGQEEQLRQQIVECRRRLEEIGDRLRALNTSGTIELADEALRYLEQQGAI